MLIRVIIQNVLSFYSVTEFNMLPNPKRTKFWEHIYSNGPVPILKTAAIYGANGAGKSNLLEVLNILQDIATDKDSLKDHTAKDYRFKLINNNTEPMSISVEFSIEDKLLFYTIKFSDKTIWLEELSLSSVDQEDDKLIFKRYIKNEEIVWEIYDENGTIINGEANDSIIRLFEKNPHSSLLSLNHEFPIVKNNDAELAYKWFDEKLIILSPYFEPQRFIDKVHQDQHFQNFINEIYPLFDSNIENIRVKVSKISDVFADNSEEGARRRDQILNLLKKANIDEGKTLPFGIRFSIAKENGVELIKELELDHRGIDNYIGTLGIQQESDGTRKLLRLMPVLYDLFNRDVVFFADEIETSVHPMAIKYFISLFTNKHNSKGQLIFTTHECHLLNQQDLLRPDEVWFASKRDGATHLYSLNEFKEHNTLDCEKGYLSGRYGAIPYLGAVDDLNN